jgi:uncharacterized membrane protein
MDSSPLLNLLVSLLLAFVSAWSLATFIKLKNVSKNKTFESACHISITEVQTGFWISLITLGLSILLIAFASVLLYKH